MSRQYIFANEEDLAIRFEAHQLEVRYVLETGILRRCNSWGVPSYRPCDVAKARLAIEEAREKGQPLGYDIKEPAKATKQPAGEPEELESLESLDCIEEEPDGEVEALVDALED